MLNVQSLNPSACSSSRWKVPELSDLIKEEKLKHHSFPFVALTETWLKSYISDAQLRLPGYTVSRSDRDARIGGGVLLYSHVNIPVSECTKFDDGTCEGIFCKFSTVKTCVAVAYRPPNAPLASFDALLSFFSSCISRVDDDSYDLMITGDYNLPNIDWHTGSLNSMGTSDIQESGQSLLSFMSRHLLSQYVMIPTRGSNTLDLFITNNDRLVTAVQSEPTKLSDHNLVDVMLAWNPLHPEKSAINTFDENSFRSLDFHKADFDVLRSKLKEMDWAELRSSSSFEEFPALCTETLLEICSSCVPLKTPPTGRPKHINALRRKRNRQSARLEALIKSNASPDHIKEVSNKVALLQYDIRCAHIRNLEEKESRAVEKIKCNPKFFYSYAKSLSQIRSSINMLFDNDESIITDTKKMADLLQEQFSSVFSDPDSPDVKDPSFPTPVIEHPQEIEDFEISEEIILSAIKEINADSAPGPDGVPPILLKNCAKELCSPLRIIWEESFERGNVPMFYKETLITPLYKKGDRARAVNYRPVALTSHVIKVYERILRSVMVDYIDRNKLLCDNQHGFRSGRSCLTQLLSHIDDIVKGLIDGADTDAIYLDFAKAFDKVDHRLLLAKMRKLGFHEKLVKWIESFLSDRKQSVVLDGVSSFSAVVLSGVPQGTVLGPLLFIIFINDMKLCVMGSIIRLFADDTRILRHIFSIEDVGALQQDLNCVLEWAKCNNMALNENKFELLVHKHSSQSALFELPFTVLTQTYQVSSGSIILPSESVKDLGVMVSSDLSWKPHICMIAQRATKVAAWVLSAFKTRDKCTMLTLYKSIIRSHLEYCCPLWNSSSKCNIQQLEGVQRSFTSRIDSVQHLDYWQRLRALNLMSLQRRRERYIIIHVWKILNGRCPNDVDIKFLESKRHGKKAVVPSLTKSSSKRNQTLYDNSFAVIGPRLWNTIPPNLHSIEDPEHFKSMLTDFVKSFPDEPPIPGYSGRNGNSLLDWNSTKAEPLLCGRSATLMTR